jgi:hypothetical protein
VEEYFVGGRAREGDAHCSHLAGTKIHHREKALE